MENEIDNSISELALENIGDNEAELNQIFKLHKSMPQIWPIVTYKRFLFQGVANFRDLGRIYNYKTKEYLELEQEKLVDVKDKQIYRCAVPLSATDKDLELFKELKIKTFIDLRSTREVEAQPFPSSILKFASYKRVEFLSTVKAQLKILTTASKLSASYRLIKSQLTKKGKKEALQYFSETVNQFELYKIIAIECGFQIATALKIITEPTNRPVVFFCSHGRDRTGIVAAMVLHCLNVPIELICSEYFLSEEGGFDEQIEIKGLKGFCRDTMWLILNWLENKYGSLSQYLKVMGFGYTWQARLRNQLISNYSSVLESLSSQPLVVPKKGVSTSILGDLPSNATPLFSSDKPTVKNYSEIQITPHSSQIHHPTITINSGQNENSTSPLTVPNNPVKRIQITKVPNIEQSQTEKPPNELSPNDTLLNVGNEKIKNSKLVYRHRKNSTSLDLSRKPNQIFSFHDINISPRSHLENKHKMQINVIDESQNNPPVIDSSSHHHHLFHHHNQEENKDENLSKKEKKEKKEREKKEEKEKEKREKKERKEREKEEKGRLKIDRKERKKISSSIHSDSSYNLNPEIPITQNVSPNNNTSSFKGEPNTVSHNRLMINMSEIPKSPSLQRKEAEKTLKRLEKDCEYKATEIQSKQQEFERKYLELKKLEIELEKLQKSIREDKSSLAQKESSLLKQLQLTLDIDAPVSPRLNLRSDLVEDVPPVVIDQSSKRVHFKKSFTLNEHLLPEKSASIPKNLKENKDN